MLWQRFVSWDNLWSAWTKVASKSPAAGVDNVTTTMFKQDAADHVTVLQHELEEQLFAPMPIKKISIRKEQDKEREIGILTVRDRIVHQGLMEILAPLFEPYFLECCYAYRPGRSALQLVRRIEEELQRGYLWALKMDIDRFFDTMDHVLLMSELRKAVDEPEILDLVEKCLKAHIFSHMSFDVNEVGALQGSSLSPLLSNIYLRPFDQAVCNEGHCYFRYSDDLLFLGREKGDVLKARKFALKHLAVLKLSSNEEKILIRNIQENELTFVGYSFQAGGKTVSKKAVNAWKLKIEAILQEKSLSFPEKVKKLDEFWKGWRNYYPEEVEAILPRAHLRVLMAGRDLAGEEPIPQEEVLQHFTQDADSITVHILLFFAEYWLQKRDHFAALLDLTRACKNVADNTQPLDLFHQYFSPKGVKPEVLEMLAEVAENLEEDAILNAVEYFIEKGWFYLSQDATAFLRRLQQTVQVTRKHSQSISMSEQQQEQQQEEEEMQAQQDSLILTEEQKECFLDLFSGREGIYAIEVVQEKHRIFRPEYKPFTPETLDSHLSAEITAGLYLRRQNDTVKMFVVDLDIGKKYLLQLQTPQQKIELLQVTQDLAVVLQKVAAQWGLFCYIEDSGYRGRHCWFFPDRPLKAATVLAFFKKLRWKVGLSNRAITWEFFPAREKVKKGRPGELIKLPLGIHGKTKRRALFLQENGEPHPDQGAFLSEIMRSDASRIEAIAAGKAPAVLANATQKNAAEKERPKDEVGTATDKSSREADPAPEKRLENRMQHFHPLWKEAPPLVRQVVNHCRLVEYLIFKAAETSYLVHRERFTLLCILGHLGEEGRDYLHQVMSHCINYDQQVTEKYIKKKPAKPVSCPRIRQEYRELTASLGCDCRFRQGKGHYPSPVLHALTGQTPSAITIPQRQHSEEKAESKTAEQKERIQSINTITQKLINLRKQQQGIEKSISACKSQLNQHFDDLQTDRISMDLGTLVKVGEQDKSDFIIEI